jgi:integrase
MAAKAKKELWPGGYVHKQKDGQPLYIIAKMVRGKRFHVSTRCHGIKPAMKQLERFEADPFNYRPEGEGGADMPMTAALIAEHIAWQLDVKKNTRKHAKQMGNRLADWMEDFKGNDLRKVTLRDHIVPALNARGANRKHRIIALKGFYSWLRTVQHRITSAEDPTLDLLVPQGLPEKFKRRKALEPGRVKAALAELDGAYRDCLLLLIGTGWHVTELERFVRSDESEIVRQPKGSKILAVLSTKHKTDWTRTPLTHRMFVEVAERLKTRGEVPRRLNAHIKQACLDAGVPVFTLGVLRHSVGSWAVQAGAHPRDVAEFLNHKDVRTTKRFYIDVAAPTISVPTLKLKLLK